mgnify:CR=1 FL=1
MSPVYPPIPATLTTAVSRPEPLPAVATAAPTCSGSATSAWTAVTRPRPAAAEPGDRPAQGRAVAVEGGDGGSSDQAAGRDGQADARGGAGDEHPYAARVRKPAGPGRRYRSAYLAAVCAQGRLSRTDAARRDRASHGNRQVSHAGTA